jgi:phage tail P2-like protein
MLKETAPPNLLNDPIIRVLLESTDPELQKVKEQIINVIIYPRIDEIEDESLLDLLAWQFHVEGYELAQTIEEKRELVKNAIELHRYKGTKYAVEKVLETLSLSGEIKEWFEYDGQPYRFKVLADISNKTEISINKLISLINDYKNERSWLEELSIEATVGNDLHISAGCVRETSFNSFFSINTSINVKPTAVVNLRL